MAYTILATWDFRTATSATGRASRIGSYTLTEEGSPSWSSSGVDCSGAGDKRLKMTMPAEMKVSPVWYVAGFRVVDATAPVEHTNIVGFRSNNTAIYETALTFVRQPSASSVRLYFGTPDNTYEGVGTSSISTGTDVTVAVARTGSSSPALKYRVDSGSWVTGLTTAAAIEYTADAVLMFGTPDSENVRTRFHWFVMGSGAITDAEAEAIQASPDTYIYPAGGSAIARISSGYHTRNINR